MCARDQIDTQDASGIDVRFLLLAHGSEQPSVESLDQDSAELAQGPIIDLATLAYSRRDWAYLYTVNGHEGDRIFQEFSSFTALVFKSGTPWEHEKLRSGVSISDVSEMHPDAEAQRHYAVAVGGTFDNLHAGHKLLLSMTAFLVDGQADEQARRLIVGITGDELLKNKKHHTYLQSWEDRQRGVADYLEAILDFRPPGQKSPPEPSIATPVTEERARSVVLPHKLMIECVEISDPFGPTITDPAISALVVSGETRDGGKAVNDKREAKGWPGLEVFEVDVLDTHLEDEPSAEMRASYEGKISSTEIRRQKSERARAKAAG
ncbi:MAG: hypothetical protein M1824_005682 [Vezdaea acicularis]|nr:MAG: hypothetical protein M1824_005682 [Vezdaea acicularis]